MKEQIKSKPFSNSVVRWCLLFVIIIAVLIFSLSGHDVGDVDNSSSDAHHPSQQVHNRKRPRNEEGDSSNSRSMVSSSSTTASSGSGGSSSNSDNRGTLNDDSMILDPLLRKRWKSLPKKLRAALQEKERVEQQTRLVASLRSRPPVVPIYPRYYYPGEEQREIFQGFSFLTRGPTEVPDPYHPHTSAVRRDRVRYPTERDINRYEWELAEPMMVQEAKMREVQRMKGDLLHRGQLPVRFPFYYHIASIRDVPGGGSGALQELPAGILPRPYRLLLDYLAHGGITDARPSGAKRWLPKEALEDIEWWEDENRIVSELQRMFAYRVLPPCDMTLLRKWIRRPSSQQQPRQHNVENKDADIRSAGGDSSSSSTQLDLRIACIGDSITFGNGTHVQKKERDGEGSYTAVLQLLLNKLCGSAAHAPRVGETSQESSSSLRTDDADEQIKAAATQYPPLLQPRIRITVSNFGHSGSTAQSGFKQSYQNTSEYKRALKFNPDILIFLFGTNDSKPRHWKGIFKFAREYRALIQSLRFAGKRVEDNLLQQLERSQRKRDDAFSLRRRDSATKSFNSPLPHVLLLSPPGAFALKRLRNRILGQIQSEVVVQHIASWILLQGRGSSAVASSSTVADAWETFFMGRWKDYQARDRWWSMRQKNRDVDPVEDQRLIDGTAQSEITPAEEEEEREAQLLASMYSSLTINDALVPKVLRSVRVVDFFSHVQHFLHKSVQKVAREFGEMGDAQQGAAAANSGSASGDTATVLVERPLSSLIDERSSNNGTQTHLQRIRLRKKDDKYVVRREKEMRKVLHDGIHPTKAVHNMMATLVFLQLLLRP